MEEWKNYFSLLLKGGKEEIRELNEQRKSSTDQERELDDEEIEKIIRKLERNKIAGKELVMRHGYTVTDR